MFPPERIISELLRTDLFRRPALCDLPVRPQVRFSSCRLDHAQRI